MRYKRNQLEDAICQTFGAEGPRARELKLRLKRLLVTDRRLAHRNRPGKRFAFYSQEAPGSGIEVMFTGYEAFAVLAGLLLLEHGIPQATVVNILRQLRSDLEAAHRETLEKDPRVLFNQKVLQANAKPGMIGPTTRIRCFSSWSSYRIRPLPACMKLWPYVEGMMKWLRS